MTRIRCRGQLHFFSGKRRVLEGLRRAICLFEARDLSLWGRAEKRNYIYSEKRVIGGSRFTRQCMRRTDNYSSILVKISPIRYPGPSRSKP